MTGVKKDLHQKRRITRSQYNRDNAFVNLQPTFDEAIAVDTATETLVPIIDVDCDDSDDDGHDDGDGEDDSYHPPDSGDSSTPSKITTAPICDIVLYPETNSAVTATTLALASEQHPNSTSNITKNIKKRKRFFPFQLTDKSYHSSFREYSTTTKGSTWHKKRGKDTLPPIAVTTIQRHAMNHYQKLKYTIKKKVVGSGGERISPRLSIEPNTNKTAKWRPSTSAFDLNSRYLRRYIIEDAMYLKSGDRVIFLVGKEHSNYDYWLKISLLQISYLDNVIIDDHDFMQIQASVINNVKRDKYLSGTMDIDDAHYHVLGAGGDALLIAFDECADSTSIEVKFSDILNEKEFQIWGNAPMKRNLYRVLYRRRSLIGKKTALIQMFDELYADHNQVVQLASQTGNLLNEKNLIAGGADIENTGAVEWIQKHIAIQGSDPSLAEFNRIVQDTFRDVVNESFGTFCSPNTPILSNVTTLYMTDQFKSLMPNQYGCISSMLNVKLKLKDKRNKHLAREYDRKAMWVFISIMRARNNTLFTWWANVTAAARYGAKNMSAGSFDQGTYFGHSTSHLTFMRNTAEFRDSKDEQIYTDKCRLTISEGNNDFIVMAMDNNQRGQRRKQQRHGISNTFIVVTHSIAIKPNITNSKDTLTALSLSRVSITYLEQNVVSVHGMSSYNDRPLTLDTCIGFINQTIRAKIDPAIDYSGERVSMYSGFVCYCYSLLQQRKYLSRIVKKYKFISDKALNDTTDIVNLLNKNRGNEGIYKHARLFQKIEVSRWFGVKPKVQMCFLPTSKEDETTNIGCAVVFFEILQNAGLITIIHKKTKGRDGVENDKLVVKLVDENKHKWVYLVGDGLTHVRLKSFINTINDSLYSFEDDYEMRSVMSQALKQVVLGVGDLHGGGFAILNSIYTLFYGGFLQVFQTALCWKRIQGKDITKTYQQAEALVKNVYNAVMRGLHYMHAEWYSNTFTLSADPATAALQIVQSFDTWTTDKLNTTTDEVFRLLLNFVSLTTRFMLFKEATTVGDSLMVETIYNEYLPVLIHLSKSTYYNIILDQIDEYYGRIPYYVLQWIRENRFQKLYDGMDRKGEEMSQWEIDRLMELMNKNMKELDFPNTMEAWLLHSQNVMMCLKSRVFVMNEYSHQRTVETHNAKFLLADEYDNSKGNVKEDSTPCKKTAEMITCSELLYLCNAFVEIPKRKFDNTTFWSLLGSITTELSDPKESSDSSSNEASIDNLSRSIFGLGQQKGVSGERELDTNTNDVDTSGLDQNIINALEDSSIRIDLETEVTIEVGDEEDVTVGVNNTKTAKIKKAVVHPSATVDVIEAGIDKMKKMNLPAIRHRRSRRLAREKQAVRDSIYQSLVSTDKKLPIDIMIEQIKENNTCALFAQWDTKWNELV